jgi:hypothetical protein
MRFTADRVALLLAGGVLLIGTPRAGRAQAAPKPTIVFAGEVGPRYYDSKLDPLAIGKFEEYRDMRARDGLSPLFEQLLLKWTPADTFG